MTVLSCNMLLQLAIGPAFVHLNLPERKLMSTPRLIPRPVGQAQLGGDSRYRYMRGGYAHVASILQRQAVQSVDSKDVPQMKLSVYCAGSFKMRKFAVRPDAACREAPQLPAELWEYIFRHLSIKDWACAAATCRPFWAVQPYRAGMCRICLDKTGSPLSEGAALESYKAVDSIARIAITLMWGQSGMPFLAWSSLGRL